MIELIALFFFSKKIRSICEEKGIKPGKWLALLIATWFGIELLVIRTGMYFFDISITDESIYALILPAMLAGIFSAYLVLQKVKSLAIEKEALEPEDLASREDEFKHFR